MKNDMQAVNTLTMKMKHLLVLALSTWVAHAAIIAPHPRNKHVESTGSCGDPLFLTEYIESGRIAQGQKAAKVSPLKGNIESYAGYLTVDKRYNSNMFFWFFPAENNSREAPVALWLQGGPGASSLWAVFNENGPYTVTNAQTLKINKHYWSQELNMIFIDNPVGTGFSFADEAGYSRNETAVGKNLYEALIQFFKLFPQYQKNKFFVTGESYAGKYVPAIAYTIHKNNPKASLKINLEGIAIGDGLVDPENMLKYGDYLYEIGMIDSKGRDQFQAIEQKTVAYIKQAKYSAAFKEFDSLLNGDLTPYKTLYYNLTGYTNYYNYLYPVEIDSGDSDSFIEKNEVRRALHAGNLTYNDGSDKVEKYLLSDIMKSVKSWLEVLMDNYRVLLYNGQLDIICAYPLTMNYVKKLEWEGKEEYEKAERKIWYVGDEIAGYSKTAGNFTEVLVRDAGHMVPHDQPKWALELITKFTRGISL